MLDPGDMVPETVTQVMQAVPPSKKRKRASAENSADVANMKRGSSNTNGDHTNGNAESYSASSTNDYSQQFQAATSNEMSSTAAAALSAQLNAPENPNLSFVSTGTSDPERPVETFDGADASQMQHAQTSPYGLAPYTPTGVAGHVQSGRETTNGSPQKPVVGTDEWHKVRRDNHKEGNQLTPPPQHPT